MVIVSNATIKNIILKVLLIYKLIWSILSSHFPTVPSFSQRIPRFFMLICFLCLLFFSCFFLFLHVIAYVWAPVSCLCPSSMCSTCIARSIKGGKYDVGQETKDFYVGVRRTIVVNDILYQSRSQTWFPVLFPVPHGTGLTISMDNTLVQSCDRN